MAPVRVVVDPPEVRSALDAVVQRALRPLTLVFVLIFGVFIVTDWYSFSGRAGDVLPALDAVLALVAGGVYLGLRQGRLPVAWAQPGAALLLALALAYLWVVMVVTNDPIQTSGQALWVIVVCIFLLSWRWTVLLVLLANAGWLILVTSLPPSPDWFQFGTLLFSASAIGLVAHGVRLRTYRNLVGLRLGDGQRQRDLEAALAKARAGQLAKDTADLQTRFVNDAAHQLATPLTPLVIHARMLTDRAAEFPPDVQRSIASLARNVDRLRRIVDHILEGANLEAGVTSFEKESFDLAAVAARSVANAHAVAKGAGVTVAYAPTGPVSARGDAARLAGVADQLIANAIEASQARGRVEVSVHGDGTEAILEVRDHGRGIAPEELPRLFQAFTQVGETRAGQGSGLGLYLAAGLVKRIGGRLTAHSDGLGKGSTFTVRLDAAAP